MRYSRTVRAYPPPDAEHYEPPPPTSEHHAFAETLPQLFFMNAPALASVGEDISPPKIEWAESDGLANINTTNSTTFIENQLDIEMGLAGNRNIEINNHDNTDIRMTGPHMEASQPRRHRTRAIPISASARSLKGRSVGMAKKVNKVKKMKKTRKVRNTGDKRDSSPEPGLVTKYDWSKLDQISSPINYTGQAKELFAADKAITIPNEPISPNLDLPLR